MTDPVDDGQPPRLADEPAQRRVVASEPRFAGGVWSVRTDTVDLGDGQQVVRDVVEHTGAVGVVAVDDDGRVLLVQQYRHPVSALLWEPPAGLLDVDGEEPLHTAQRELYEEAGHRARDWSVLVDVYTSPGGSDEALRIYLARELTAVDPAERHIGDGEERDMPVAWVPLADARRAVLDGRLHSPTAVVGILAAATLLLDGREVGGAPRAAGAPWQRPLR